jgi:hypothetical protein
VGFEQVAPLGDLYVTWTGGDRVVELAPPGARPDAAASAPASETEEEDYI